MIIACPACKTRYVVPDSAIGVEGRTVRCAKCKHSWFQEGPAERADAVPARSSAKAQDRVSETASVSQGAGAAPAEPTPHSSASSAEEATKETQEQAHSSESDFGSVQPPYGDIPSPAPPGQPVAEEISQFDPHPPFRPRRNWIKLATWSAAVFALVALGITIAVNTTGLPSWVPVERPLFAMAQPGLKIDFPVSEQERRTLPNGAEFFGARVIVTNQSRETKSVPPLQIVLRDERERVVYSWEITPTQKSLAPGESMTINEAVTDIPKSAVYADIGWAPR